MEESPKFKLVFKSTAVKHLKLISKNKSFAKKVAQLLSLLENEGPFVVPPKFEALKGDLKGLYSRRLNIRDRLVY